MEQSRKQAGTSQACGWSIVLGSVLAGALFIPVASCHRKAPLPSPETIVTNAWNDFRLGEYDRAASGFEKARALAATGSVTRRQATYGLATVWGLRLPIVSQDRKRARRLYREIITTAPRSDLAAWSLLALARMQHLVPVGEEPDYDAVRKAYREVIRRFPDHLAGQEAFIYLQSTYVATLQTNDARRAITSLKKFIREHPDSGFVGAAYSLMAVSYTTLGDQEKRLEAEIQAFKHGEVDPTNPYVDHAWTYWNIATIAEFEVGDFETARKYYRRLIKEYPTDIRKYGAKQALRRMDAVEKRLRRAADGGKGREGASS